MGLRIDPDREYPPKSAASHATRPRRALARRLRHRRRRDAPTETRPGDQREMRERVTKSHFSVHKHPATRSRTGTTSPSPRRRSSARLFPPSMPPAPPIPAALPTSPLVSMRGTTRTAPRRPAPHAARNKNGVCCPPAGRVSTPSSATGPTSSTPGVSSPAGAATQAHGLSRDRRGGKGRGW